MIVYCSDILEWCRIMDVHCFNDAFCWMAVSIVKENDIAINV
jgi:hypothetical protein